jgi:hypothetical protein
MNAPAPRIEIPAPGTSFGGGFFSHPFILRAEVYGLVIANKAHGEFRDIWHKSTRKIVAGALSYNDGLANTIAMAEAGSPLATRIRELRLGDHDDWYLFDRAAALGAFYELQGTEAFKEGGVEAFEQEAYWTSTQYAGHASSAWSQDLFYGGYQDYHGKASKLLGRAVRRVKL